MTTERSMDPSPPLHPILGIAFLNFIFLFLALIVFFSFFAVPSGFEVRMPVIGGNIPDEGHVTVRVTSENVLYFNDKVVTLNDLKKALMKLKLNASNALVYVRVDRRASMGRVADVWEMCKGLGVARVKVVASQEN
jgi:biopolymer transport protein ExbD